MSIFTKIKNLFQRKKIVEEQKQVEKKENIIDPLEYFQNLKNSKVLFTTNEGKKLKKICFNMMKKAILAGQISLVRKLKFAIDCYSKEEKVLKNGIKFYLTKEQITEFLDKVEKQVVKIIELEKFPREIPDDIAKQLQHLKKNNVFDQYFVIFTDYTGKIEKTIKRERRRKDPVLLGTFEKENNGIRKDIDNLFDRFYYIADWQDEYCDITLDKILKTISLKQPTKIKLSITNKQVYEFLNNLKDKDSLNSNLSNVSESIAITNVVTKKTKSKRTKKNV